MAPSKPEDDFVLTLSDNDEILFSDLESDASDAPQVHRGIKRKRTNNDDDTKGQRGQKGSEKRSAKKEKRFTGESSDSASEEKGGPGGVQDGAIDSDFEFDLGGNAVANNIEDFDVWGDLETTHKNQRQENKKGVDIDGIIARHAAKRKESNNGNANVVGDDWKDDGSEGERNGELGDDEVADLPNFEDDELLANDTFGADAQSEDDDEQENEISLNNESDSNLLYNSEGNTDSDYQSVASPTAHPDDLESDHSEPDNESQTSTSDVENAAKRAAFFAPEDISKNQNADSLKTSFQQFSLSRPILRALAALSFATPTPIQRRTIPMALQGVDVVGSAVTGSGKTAAFLLPILERLLYRPRKIPTTRVAILMPTRELAVQCYNMAGALARFTDVTFAQIVGGFSVREQENVLKKRPDVVIATPGRFIDHMRNSASFAVETIEILVLDEADRMLDTGFEDELDEILKTLPKGRQTMLFSATMTDDIDKLVRVGMNRPVRVSADAKKSTTAGLVQEFVRLRPGREEMRLATLCVLSTKIFTERTIIFFRQKKEAHRVRIVFGLLGLKAGELHGSMSQEQRINAVHDFRDGKSTHLLATDLASRGLDIKNILTVINYEAPQSHEIYLHRVGRTARAGKSGRSCTIAAEPDRKVVKAAVKSGRKQAAKIVSRFMETKEIDEMNQTLAGFQDDIEVILREEKEEKQMAQAEMQLSKGQNIVQHESEIMSRPKRTWFESEKQKRQAKNKGRIELNGPATKLKKENKKLSNKDKKKLDDRRARSEGMGWRKGKGSEQAAKRTKHERSKQKKNSKAKARR